MESYREGVKLMDEYMGRVFYALEHNGYDENTLVIVTADHGTEFPGGKKTLQDAGIRVMLLLRFPMAGGTPFAGQVVESLVSHLDLYPTLCELLGRQPEHPLEGKSLLPLIRGETEDLHDAIFAEQTYHGLLEPLRWVRTKRYKYIRRHFATGPIMRHDGPPTPILEGCGWYERPLGHEELFDLYLDPWEACNRAQDPTYAGIREELARRLDEWMEKTGDPFPTGQFPPPPSGRA